MYQPLAVTKIPVYVGQALSHNSATGKETAGGSSRLWQRIRDHSRSISGTADLILGEFGARLLAMPDVHSDLGENGLRVFYKPVWNAILNGFGSHEQGQSTRQSGKSRWDTVHPGRARTFGDTKYDRQDLIAQAREHISEQLANYGAAPWRDA